MYTHYIPCAKISGTSYSCSEDLAKVFTSKSAYQLLVAFKAYFEGTNAHKALTFLKEGAIVPFQKLFDGTFHHVNPADVQNLNFQSEVYQCLMNHPISHCAGDEENTKKVVAFFVNLLTYSYTRQYKKRRGKIIDTAKSYKSTLSMKIGKLIDDNLKDDCKFCSQKNRQTLAAAEDTIKFCVFRSLQVVDYFGQPTSQKAVFENTWVQYEGKWKDIYSQSPVLHKERAPGGVCAKWTESVESLCGALTASADGPSTSQQSHKAKRRKRPSKELQPTPQRSEEATPKSQQSDEAQVTPDRSDEAQATPDRSDEAQATSERSDEDEPTTEWSDEDESTSERSDEEEPTSERSDEDEPTSERSDEDEPTSERSDEDETTSDRSEEDEPTSERSEENEPTSERSDEDETTSDWSAEDEPTSGRSEEDEPTSERSDEDKPTSERSDEDKPTSERPEEDKPTSERSDEDDPTSERSDQDEIIESLTELSFTLQESEAT